MPQKDWQNTGQFVQTKICRHEILGLNNLDNMSQDPICYKH